MYAESAAGLRSRRAGAGRDGTSVVGLAHELGVTRTRLARDACASVESLELYGDARETLDRLRERATRMAVVTNLPGWLVLPVARAVDIEGYFAAIVTPRIGVPAKPQPHGIRKALAEMGRETDPHTWLVGDGAADAGAAVKAGVRFAWASYGYETVQPSGAETVLQSFEDVLRL